MTRAGTVIDASVLREAMSRFSEALEAHREEIDSLNVFPVPDGDTGTNMALTQRAVREALDAAGDEGLPELGRILSRAALMGARGNSGVILAQVLRGLCDGLGREGDAGAHDLAEAMARASDQARRAVAEPEEGTALTVLAAAAEAAVERAGEGAVAEAVARAALEGARAASERTRDMLPELRAAGVVDAGGRGMVLLFDALAAALGGGSLTEKVGPLGPVGHSADVEPHGLQQRYEVTYLWEGPDEAVPELIRALNGAGDSVVVVGGDGLFKAHVHTNESDSAVAAGATAGWVRQARVVDLQTEVAERCVAGQAREVRAPPEVHPTGLVALADGDGIIELFSSLGASVLPGGPGNNPSVGDLVRAIEAVASPGVVVVPNHPNLVRAAREAAAASAKAVTVIPATSVPAGLAAAAAFNPVSSREENERAMTDAAEGTTSIELTVAARDAVTAGGRVERGAWIAMADGDVVEVGSDPVELAAKSVARMRSDDHEILTVFVGRDPTDEEAAKFAAELRDAAAGLGVETHRGGQPHYRYLIGLE